MSGTTVFLVSRFNCQQVLRLHCQHHSHVNLLAAPCFKSTSGFPLAGA